MASVLTEIIFIYLLAWMCCVQGQTSTGMLHDYTCMPFVQCSATLTTEVALTVSMEEVVKNVPLVLHVISDSKSTCSVYNNFSLCAIHDTSNSSKAVTVKTFFPSELPRNASQFGCTVTRIYTNAQPSTSTYLMNVTSESTTSTLTFTNPSTLSLSSATENGYVTILPEHDCPKDRTVTVIVLAVLLAIFILISIIFIITTIILIRRLKGNSDKRKETNLMLSETAPQNKYENVKNAQNNNLSASSKTKTPLKLEVDVDDNGYASTTGSSASINANPGYSVPWNSDRLPVKPSPSLVRIKGFERKDNDLVKPSPSLVRIKGFERKDNDPVKPSHGLVHHEGFDRKDNDPVKPNPGLVHHEGFDRKDNDPVKPSPGLVHHEGLERKDNDPMDEEEVCTESTPTKF